MTFDRNKLPLATKPLDATHISTSNNIKLYTTIAGGIRIDLDDEDATILHIAKEDLHYIPELIALLRAYVKLWE